MQEAKRVLEHDWEWLKRSWIMGVRVGLGIDRCAWNKCVWKMMLQNDTGDKLKGQSVYREGHETSKNWVTHRVAFHKEHDKEENRICRTHAERFECYITFTDTREQGRGKKSRLSNKIWIKDICEWKGLGTSEVKRAAEDRKRWKLIVVNIRIGVDKWMNEWMNEWVNEWKKQQIITLLSTNPNQQN